MSNKRGRLLRIAVISAVPLTGWGQFAKAGTDIWTGSTDNTWNAANNWNPAGIPAVGDSLVFNSTATTTGNLNNNGTFNLSSITFSSGAATFNIGDGTSTANAGNTILLGGGITDSSTNAETFYVPLILTTSQTFASTTAAGSLNFAGNINGSGIGLTTGGGNSSTLGAGATNTNFTGSVTLGALYAVSYSSNGQVFANNPTTTFNNSSLTVAGSSNVSRGNLTFTGNTVANFAGIIKATGDWARVNIFGNASVTCPSFNISTGVTGGFNLSGGSLTTGSIFGIESTDGTYTNHNYFNGTQMIATGSNASFLNISKSSAFSGGSTGYAGANGAIFNTSGYNIGTTVGFVDTTSSIPGTLTVLGGGSLTLSGLSGIDGSVNINSGTLIANVANAALTNTVITPNTSAIGAPDTAHNVYVNNGGTLNFNVSNVLGSNSNTNIQLALVVNTGAIVTSAAGAANTLGPVNLAGGTMNAGTGSFYFRQPVLVSGTVASTLTNSTGGAFNLLSIASGGTNFNVSSTGAVGGDLLVPGVLTNTPTGTGGQLTKSGPGTMVLTGSNTYTGATVVNAGTLTFGNAGAFPANTALTNNAMVNFSASPSVTTFNGTSNSAVTNVSGNTLTVTGGGSYAGNVLASLMNVTGGSMVLAKGASVTGNLSVSNAGLSTVDGVIGTASVAGTGSFSSSAVSFDLGNSVSSDKLTFTGAVTTAGTDTINLNLLTGQSLSNGSYTLMTAASGLGGSNFVLGTVPAGFSTYNLSNSTSTTEVLTVTAKPPVPTLYWTGAASTTGSPSDPNNNWGYGSGLATAKSNWSNISGGTVDALNVPGSITDVYFTAANAVASAGSTLSTQLDGSYAIKGLFIATPSSAITSVGINTSSNTLAIGSDGLTVTNGSNAGLTIIGSGSVALTASQSWANNNSLPLNVSTGVSAFSGATTLTINGSGSGGVTLGGTISNGGGTLGLVLGQAGTTLISGNNTFTGGVTLNTGTIVLGNAGALNSATPNAITFGAGSNADLQMGGFGLTVASLNTNAAAGSPIIENASATAATLTANIASGTSTYAGNIQDGSGGAALSLTTLGAGSLVLSGPLSYSGLTTVGNGSTLTLSGTQSTTGNMNVSSGGSLVLSGNSTATGAINLANNSILTLVANSGNTVSGASSAIGAPSAVNYANNLNTTNVRLRGDSDVTFTNASPSAGTGGYPNFTILNFDVNNLGGASTATNHTLALGNTTSGTAGFATYNTTINVTGGNGYTLSIPSVTTAFNTFLNLNASTANLTIPGGISNVATLTVTGAGSTSLGSITGAGPVVKTGGGTLTFAAANSYTGATNISAGTLAIGSSGSIGSTGTITIGSAGTLDITANPSFALAGTNATLGGTGLINGPYMHSLGILSPGGTGTIGTLSETGTLTLGGGTVNLDISGSNSSTGGINNDLLTVNGGLTLSGITPFSVTVPNVISVPSGTTYTVLTYSGALNASSGSITLGSSLYSLVPLSSTPGKVEIRYSTGLVQNLTWTGSNSSDWDVSTTPNWLSSGNSALFNNSDKVTFDDSSTVSTTNVNIPGTVMPGSVTINSSANNYTFSGPGSIAGNTGLVKSGSSTLTMSTSNTYTGDTNVSGGSLALTGSTGSDLGTGNLLIGSNATVQVLAGNGADANSTLTNASVVNSGSLIFNTYVPVGLNLPISGSGTVVQMGSGIVGFNVANNYSGGTTISNGTLYPNNNSAFGTGLVTVNGGQVFGFGYTYPNAFNLSSPSSAAVLHAGGGLTTTVSGPVTLVGDTILQIDGNAGVSFLNTPNAMTGANYNLTVNGDANSTFTLGGSTNLGTGTITVSPNTTLKFAPPASTTITISTQIVSAGTVSQNGPGVTILAGSNTYSGGTTVTAGTLVLASSTALPSGNPVNVGPTGTLQIASSTGNSSYVATVGSLTNTGVIDVVNNAMVLQNANASIGTINGQVGAGFNFGKWNGNSATGVITSSAAANDTTHLRAVGVATGLTSFSAQGGMVSVNPQDVLIKYTYFGDANLDGKVDGSDYSMIDFAFINNQSATATQVTGWQNGDFNYDGVINGSDYTLIDNAFNTQGAQIMGELANPSASVTAELGSLGSPSAVPEPGCLGAIGIGITLLGRRTRRSSTKLCAAR